MFPINVIFVLSCGTANADLHVIVTQTEVKWSKESNKKWNCNTDQSFTLLWNIALHTKKNTLPDSYYCGERQHPVHGWWCHTPSIKHSYTVRQPTEHMM